VRILILGGNGMLGHQLLLSLKRRHDVKVTLRRDISDYSDYGLFTLDNAYAGIDVRSSERLSEIFTDFHPDTVINAIGVIKQRKGAKACIPNLEINALLPHRLSMMCKKEGARLVHMSTDCIFSGNKGNYNENDISDADDLYGRSKYLGEVKDKHCVTLRTSIIGLELSYKNSLIEWFLSKKGKIKGFHKAIYTGLTTMEMARVIEFILVEHKKLFGVYHVASDPIDKYNLLSKLSEILQRNNLTIELDNTFVCDRSLNAERFNKTTGYAAPTWDDMLQELANLIILREKGELV